MELEINWKSYATQYDIMCQNLPPYQELMAELIKIVGGLKLSEDYNICDLGSGTGNLSIKIANKLNRKVTSIEFEEEFLLIQKEKIFERGLEDLITLKQGDVTSSKLCKTNSLDVALMVHVLNFMDENLRDSIIENIYSYLKPNGYFIISDIGREIDIEKFSKTVKEYRFLEFGDGNSIEFFESLPYVLEANKIARQRQKKGLSYMHDLNEFCYFLEKFGFEILEKRDDLYGGIDDFVIAQKSISSVNLK